MGVNNGLVMLSQLYKTHRYAQYFFQELASMQKPKSAIDIDRRRKSVNKRYNLRLSKSDGEEFFRHWERAGLGKLTVRHGAGSASTFKFSGDFDFVAVCQELIKTPSEAIPVSEPVHSVSIIRLRSGTILRLNSTDVSELREVLAEL